MGTKTQKLDDLVMEKCIVDRANLSADLLKKGERGVQCLHC